MPQFIAKPHKKKVDIQICIPVYKRETALIDLVKSIEESLEGINYNLYFLLNGATENAKNLVTKKLGIKPNFGIVFFEENIKEDIFIWPFFNLPKGLTWVIGDDDFLNEESYNAVLNALNHDLTILNYDLYDKNLEHKLIPSYLEGYFLKSPNPINIKYLFSNLGEKLAFISSVIINTNIIAQTKNNFEPKSFQYASLIYYSILKYQKQINIHFEKKICLKQRGNNISLDDKSVVDEIFINEIRVFYLLMFRYRKYRIPAIFKLIKYTFIQTPRLMIRSKIEGRTTAAKGFFIVDHIYLFIVKVFVRFLPKSFFQHIRNYTQ